MDRLNCNFILTPSWSSSGLVGTHLYSLYAIGGASCPRSNAVQPPFHVHLLFSFISIRAIWKLSASRPGVVAIDVVVDANPSF